MKTKYSKVNGFALLINELLKIADKIIKSNLLSKKNFLYLPLAIE